MGVVSGIYKSFFFTAPEPMGSLIKQLGFISASSGSSPGRIRYLRPC